jgi:DNA-directed RNA polymerase specialized sigma24 family protein
VTVQADDALARLVRDEGTGVLATLIRVLGQADLARDAAQDAMVRALETWPRDGVPDNPRGWLLATAKRRAVSRAGTAQRWPAGAWPPAGARPTGRSGPGFGRASACGASACGASACWAGAYGAHSVGVAGTARHTHCL